MQKVTSRPIMPLVEKIALTLARTEAESHGAAVQSLSDLEDGGRDHYLMLAKAVADALGQTPDLRALCGEAVEVMRRSNITGSSNAETGLLTIERLEDAANHQ